MDTTAHPFAHIKGWGIDANPANEPTFPLRKRVDLERAGYGWQRPAQQPLSVEVLQSNERPNPSSVVGTSTPPSGLSGILRRHAFKHSESSYAHWLPLMLADRINVLEGVAEDLSHGRVPNIFAELGWKAEWQFNRKNMVTRLLVIGGVVGFVAALASRKPHRPAPRRLRRHG